MARIILFAFLFIFFQFSFCYSQNLYFPPISSNVWETASPNSLGWCEKNLDSLKNYLSSQNTKAFIVLKDGKIVVEWYFGTFTTDNNWYWASAGKTITSFLIGKAQEDGLLSINHKTSQYLGAGWTSCTTAQENAITIKNQLSMNSGLNDAGDSFCTLPSCLTYLTPPNTRWAYHNAPYTLLDGVIEGATGQTLQAYTTSTLQSKTGITGLWIKSGYNNVFYSKPRMMARFGILMQNNGIWNGQTVMGDLNYLNQARNSSQTINPSYGYLWWLNGKSSFMVPQSQLVFQGPLFPDAPTDTYTALGKNGQILSISPSTGLIIVRMGDSPSSNNDDELVSISLGNDIWKKLNLARVSCTPTALNNPKEMPFKIYPNPTKNIIHLESPFNDFEWEIKNITGQTLRKGKSISAKVSLENLNLAQGVYLLSVQHLIYGIFTTKILVEN
ncbi:MAG: serine hydrolase [Raineya sp.]|jgi:CubicO group peptidase (beta-lactamase class C family)|nr:serine hydrolase [Raineya sp.]